MARPSLKFTDEDRKLVEELSGYGVPFVNIASLISGGIDHDTLTRHFKAELMQGKAKANAKIGSTLFQKAMDGDTSALIFWAKTQMRWRENNEQETETAPEPKQIIFNIKNARIESPTD
jgi:hypothetical protein